MADVVANIAKGQIAQLATLPGTSDAFLLLALKSAGLESDALLIDYATVAAMLAGASDEATNSGYARKTITSAITVTPDNTNNWQTVDMPDQTWTSVSATGGNWGKFVLVYDPNTGTSTDSTRVPLIYFDAVDPGTGTVPLIITGSDVTAQINGTGLIKCV